MIIFILMIAINSLSYKQGFYNGYENGLRSCYKPIQNITDLSSMNISNNNANYSMNNTWSVPRNNNTVYLSTFFDEFIKLFQ